MSWPAEKAEPLAAITTARTLASSLISLSAACSSAIIPSDRLLRAEGRLSVSTAILPCISCSRFGDGGLAARAARLVIEISIFARRTILAALIASVGACKFSLLPWQVLARELWTGNRRSDMAIAKMGAAELEKFLEA